MTDGYSREAGDDRTDPRDDANRQAAATRHDPDATDGHTPQVHDHTPPDAATPHDRTFGWRGWILVVVIVFAFVVIPGLLYVYPHVGPMSGLPFRATYLVLPFVPALVLAALAVWATTRP